ncbi:phage tail spike protein [Streptococcus hillyeri]|uniref:phage tail spike protein n=1 Tax=Streptococcus hillyeri TaxID=2282420 RepID=UPI0034E1E06F
MEIKTSKGVYYVNADYAIEEKQGEYPKLTCTIPASKNRSWIDDCKELDRLYTPGEQDEFVIINPVKITKGNSYDLEITAVGAFEFDFVKSRIDDNLPTRSYTVEYLLDLVFKDARYSYDLQGTYEKREFTNFGSDNRYKLFLQIMNRFNLEFKVIGKIVRINSKVGNDTGFQFRYLKNIKDTKYSVDATNLVTHVKGYGAYHDANDQSKGRLEVEYLSPLSDIYGKLSGEPVVDERMSISATLLEKCKQSVESSVAVTVSTTLVALKNQEYRGVARVGDSIWFIDERIDLEKKIRFSTVKSYYDAFDELIKQDVQLGDKDVFSRVQSSDTASQSKLIDMQKELSDQLADVEDAIKKTYVMLSGVNRVFYSSDLPEDVPKGTIKEGDTLFRNIDGETKMYRWDGVQWELVPVVNDVEKFREELDNEIAQVTAQIEASSAEHERQVSDIRAQATDAKTLAQQAQQIGTQAKIDAIAEANRLIASAKQTLDGQLSQQAQQLLTQASAQEQLTRRTTAIEQLANGTKATLIELSKTVSSQTGQIDSVSKRTKIVEDGISGLATQYANLKVGGSNLLRHTKRFAGNFWIWEGNWIKESYRHQDCDVFTWQSGVKTSPAYEITVDAGETYTFSAYIKKASVGRVYFYLDSWQANAARFDVSREDIITEVGQSFIRYKRTFTVTQSGLIKPRFAFIDGGLSVAGYQLERGSIMSDYHEHDEDIRSELATYKQMVEQNLAEISRQTQTTAGDVSQLKTFREQTVSQLRDVVSASQFDNLTGRMTQLETDITTQAGELAKRLTRTQVEQAITDRGYQTKSQVDSNIAGRGYITLSALQPYATATTVQNLVTETAGSFERKITETKALIPTSTSVNLVDGTKDFSGSHFWIDGNWRLDGRTVAGADVLTWQSGNKASPTLTWQVEAGKEYIFSAYVAKETIGTVYFYLYNFGGDDITSTTRRNHHIDDVGADFKRFTLHFVPTRSGKIRARFAILASDVGGFSVAGYQLLEGRLEQPWGPSAKELSVVTGFNSVKDTVDAHKRVIGDGSAISQAIQSASKFERSIAIGGDIYQAIETAKGLVQEVRGADGLKTQMSQLAGSWAVKNLTSAGTVLNQLNLNKDGSVKIDGKLVQITGTTYIQDGVITSAKIASLDAAKITAGTLDASKVNVINLNASKIVGLDADFIKAKIDSALVGWLRGKVISAQNDAMQINLNQANITFNQNSDIKFNSVSNTINRTRGSNVGFLKFEDSPKGGVNVILGATSGNVAQTINTSKFSGIVANRDNDTSDYLELYGDYIYFKHAKNSGKLTIHTASIAGDYNLIGILDKLIHNMNKLHRAGAFGRQTHFTDDVSGVGFFD